MTIAFNTDKAGSVDDIHSIIAKALDFPEHYGANLDALYDCLTDIDLPAEVVWKGFEKSKKKFGESVDQILEVFEDFSAEDDDFTITVE